MIFRIISYWMHYWNRWMYTVWCFLDWPLWLGAISQSSSSPVPRLCLVTSSWQQTACGASGVGLCYSETVQLRVVSCYSYNSAAVSFVSCRTCWRHWELD